MVPFRSQDRRWNAVSLGRAQLGQSSPNFLERCQLRGRVANDPALSNVFASGFKLGLHKHNDLPPAWLVGGKGGGDHGGKNERCRDERYIYGDELHIFTESRVREKAGVRFLQ